LVADALAQLLDDPARRGRMATAGRERAVQSFSYDILAARLGAALTSWEAAPRG
jgi:glycosyltransferase involved in cell wall biosynthesis